MRTRHAVLAVMAPAIMVSGCYTVLKAPYSADYDEGRSKYAAEQRQDDYPSPRVGRFDDRGSGFVDPYGSYGAGAYGQGGGFPIFGYDSRYGGFGGYGSGYSPYSSRSGPYGYGYDPYYQGDGGVYIPPGYELVTTEELNRLRTDDTSLPSFTPTVGQSADPVDLRQQRIDQAQDTWTRRVTPRERKSPQPTKYAAPSSSASSSSSAKETSSTKSSGKSKAKKRQKRR